MPFITHSGSKQFIVTPGQRFAVDNLKEVKEDDIIDLPLLLAFGEEKGQTKLQAKVIGHAKGVKIRVVKFKSKSNYHKQYGFRAFQTVLEIISGNVKPRITKKAEVTPVKEVKTKVVKAKTEKTKVAAK